MDVGERANVEHITYSESLWKLNRTGVTFNLFRAVSSCFNFISLQIKLDGTRNSCSSEIARSVDGNFSEGREGESNVSPLVGRESVPYRGMLIWSLFLIQLRYNDDFLSTIDWIYVPTIQIVYHSLLIYKNPSFWEQKTFFFFCSRRFNWWIN